ncbi:MAG: TetR/AcrR family transcriptional regulator [Saprospiraceae bacterium]|nr:TetR/AcrR family transcriptional regulator [Saprospiraceae bacterium]MDZ4703690.1 TetR/AcrR family transcriptional regulator [Saprospiraceae bacterium]
MGVAERKLRAKEEMRHRILETARKLFLEKGFEHTSLRNIAEAIEYSPATIYLYFKDKNELFHALHIEGFKMMLEYMQPLTGIPDPFERLVQLSYTYIRFARENPEFYDLMFIMNAPMDALESEEKWAMGDQTFGFVVNLIEECQKTGRFQGKNAYQLAFHCWASVHGLVSLEIRQRTRVCHDEKMRACLVEDSLAYFIDAMSKL